MELKVVALYDKTRSRLYTTLTGPTVGLIIRDNARMVQQVFPHFLEDIELYEVGSFSEEERSFKALEKPLLHDWEEYKSPEKEVKPLTPEQKKDFTK